MYNETAGEYKPALSDNSEPAVRVQKWINELEEDATFNLQSYTECFISENLVRRLIKHKSIVLDESSEAKKKAMHEVERWRKREDKDKRIGNIAIDIRGKDDDLFYLDLAHLASIADPSRSGDGYPDYLTNDEKAFTPIRNAVMHTSRLTQDAKDRLTTVYANIKAKIRNLLSI